METITVLLCALGALTTVFAKTVTYDFNVTWTTANPDGKFERKTIGINGKWPIPAIVVDKGDRVIINLYNGLGDQDTSLHFHGLFQNGTTHMDGPIQVTQCPLAPGQRMTYDFNADQPGTYWYHSHNKGQYPDGLRGPFIVHDPEDPHRGLYDEEIVLTLSDWYHEQMPKLIGQFLSYTNPTGAEPVPQAALMNDAQNIDLQVEPGKTYLVRMVNIAAFAAQYVWFEEHTMRVVEVDGVYTEPMEASMLYLTAAQRVSVLLTTKNDTSKNYAFVGSMDEDLFDQVPPGLNQNVTGWLVYNKNAPKPEPKFIDEFEPLDDFLLVPQDGHELLPQPAANHTITLDVTMDNLGDGANYAFFNGITYIRQKVPTLYTALTTGDFAANPVVYGVNSHSYVLDHMSVVDIILNNNDPGKHPFHLHGHNFQVLHRSEADAGAFDPTKPITPPKVPMRRDVVLAPPNGNIVLRFRADNAGIWLFHCHLEWHLVSGLVMTMVEAPLQLQKTLAIPDDHKAACQHKGIPMAGNAAGNTKNFLDLAGANTSPEPLPPGFTTRGIVALVFSVIAAILGMAVIVVYGLAEPLPQGTAVGGAAGGKL